MNNSFNNNNNNNHNNDNQNIDKRYCSFKLIRKKTKFKIFSGYKSHYPNILADHIKLKEFNEFIHQLNIACNSKFKNRKLVAYSSFFFLICSLFFIPFLINFPQNLELFIITFLYVVSCFTILYISFKSIISLMEKELKCTIEKYNNEIFNNRNLRIDLIKKYNKRRTAIFKIYIIFPIPKDKYIIINNNKDNSTNNSNNNSNNNINKNIIIDNNNNIININNSNNNDCSIIIIDDDSNIGIDNESSLLIKKSINKSINQ